MSVKIMAAVFDSPITDKSETLVLLALANHCDDDGVCYPSIGRIAFLSRLTDRGAQKVISRLEGRGILSRNVGGGRHGTSVYQINIEALNPEPGSPPNPVHPRTGVQKTPNGSAENPEPGSPEPSITINNHQYPPVAPQPDRSPSTDGMPSKARLPENWILPESSREYALSKGLTEIEIEELANDFHAYWTDRTDSGGRKSQRGWEQAWRNRVTDRLPAIIRSRNAAKRSAYGRGMAGGGISAELADFGAQWAAEGAARRGTRRDA